MKTNIQTYEDIKINTLRSTVSPNMLLQAAADTTQKRCKPSEVDNIVKLNDKLIPYLVKANHMSLFEHMSISFGIEGVSRALLAQLTRHRMASYTVSSQHYQDYSDYPMILDSMHADYMEPAVKSALTAYKVAINRGVPKEEARQILPNAMSCNLIWTINARSLFNFLNLRLCKRNTNEMLTFARYIRYKAVEWWGELFSLSGPDCYNTGDCTQGHMTCGMPMSREIEMEVYV